MNNRTLSLAALVLALSLTAVWAAEGVMTPFNGKNLDGWKAKPQGKNVSAWKVGTAKLDPDDPKRFKVEEGGNELINDTAGHGKSCDFYTTDCKHGDAIITLEVCVPKGSNSGIYVQGEYEIQVLDSYGKEKNPGAGDMGAVYGAAPPKNPKYVKPGEWSTYEIHFQAPKFDASGKKTANARLIKVVLNGAVIHEDLEMPKGTPGGVDGKEKAEGPLMFQGNHGPIAYRNIKIAPLK